MWSQDRPTFGKLENENRGIHLGKNCKKKYLMFLSYIGRLELNGFQAHLMARAPSRRFRAENRHQRGNKSGNFNVVFWSCACG